MNPLYVRYVMAPLIFIMGLFLLPYAFVEGFPWQSRVLTPVFLIAAVILFLISKEDEKQEEKSDDGNTLTPREALRGSKGEASIHDRLRAWSGQVDEDRRRRFGDAMGPWEAREPVEPPMKKERPNEPSPAISQRSQIREAVFVALSIAVFLLTVFGKVSEIRKKLPPTPVHKPPSKELIKSIIKRAVGKNAPHAEGESGISPATENAIEDQPKR